MLTVHSKSRFTYFVGIVSSNPLQRQKSTHTTSDVITSL